MSSNRRWWWAGWLALSTVTACATGSTLDGDVSDEQAGKSDAGHGHGGAGRDGGGAGHGGSAGSGSGGAGGSDAHGGAGDGAGGDDEGRAGGAGELGEIGGADAGGGGDAGGAAGRGGDSGVDAGDGGAVDASDDADAAGEPIDAGAGDAGATDGSPDADIPGDAGCTAPVSGPCNAFPQCGCEDGQSCRVTGTAGETSCSANGATPAQHGCTTSTDCTAGYACVSGSCKPFCATDDDCGGDHKSCMQIGKANTTTPIPNYKVCSAQCDLVDPAATCGAGSTCVTRGSTTAQSTDCLGGAGNLEGEGTCSKDRRTCAPGYICVLLPDFWFGDYENCSKWCRIGSAYKNDCKGTGGSCTRFDQPTKIDGVEYGFCY